MHWAYQMRAGMRGWLCTGTMNSRALKEQLEVEDDDDAGKSARLV